MLTESLTWYEPAERMPDHDTTVMLEFEEVDGEPVWPGYFDGEDWLLADGMPAGKVKRWSEMPKGGAA